MTDLSPTSETAETATAASRPRRSAARLRLLPLMSGMLLTMIPVTMLVPVLKEIVVARYGVSASWAHAFMSINLFGAVLFAPVGGYLADRLRTARPILVVALLVDAALLFAMSLAPTFVTLMTLRFFEGGAHVLAVSMWMAAAAASAEPARAGATMGALGAAVMFGTGFGSALGGQLGNLDDLAVLRIGPMIAVVAAIIAGVWLPTLRDRPHVRGIADAAGIVRQNRWLLVPYVYAFVDRVCVGVIVSTLMLYLSEVLGLTPGARGGMMAAFVFPMAFLTYPAGRLSDRWGRAAPLAVGSILFGIVMVSYGLLAANGLWFAMMISGVLSAVMFAPSLALCRDFAPESMRTTAFAGFNAAGSLGFMCGPLLGMAVTAALGDSIGFAGACRWTFAVAGAAEVLCAVVTLPFLVQFAARGAAARPNPR